MNDRSVVTVFIEHGSKICLFKRSSQVATYVGKYAGVSGSVEDGRTPFEQAKAELLEETGLSDGVTLLAEADPVVVEAEDIGTRFLIYPFLVHTESVQLQLNFEHVEARWVEPATIKELDAVPGLWEVFEAVASNDALGRAINRLKEQISSDRISGSLGLAARGVNTLALGELQRVWYGGQRRESFFELAEEIANLRGGMEVIRNAAAFSCLEVQRGGSDGLSDRLFSLAHALVNQRGASARRCAEWLRTGGYRKVFTLSWSTTVHDTLVALGPEHAEVNLVESSPGREGIQLAEKLAREGFRVTLYPDSSMHVALRHSQVVLLGSDAVLSSGHFVNKTGSYLACALGERLSLPVLVVTETMKFSPTTVWQRETAPWRPAAPHANLNVWTEPFEEVPGDYVHRFVTDKGVITGEEAQMLCLNVQDELKRYGLFQSFYSTQKVAPQ